MATLKNILVTTLLIMAGLIVFGQEQPAEVQAKQKDREPVYDSITDRVLLRREFAGGILLHSRGWGLHFRKGRNLSYFR